jgi:hypothetical protein
MKQGAVIMANIFDHVFRLGGTSEDRFINYKTRSGKTITTDKALFDNKQKYIKTKKGQEIAALEATTYANFAHRQEVYLRKARGTGTTPYYMALADWFEPPKVLQINIDDWTGKIGQTIHIKARDNLKVARVSVVIRDAEENVLEMGEAVQASTGSAWWSYTTRSQVTMSPFPVVEATAQDRPGNRDTFVIS